jgi:hypothetical protein
MYSLQYVESIHAPDLRIRFSFKKEGKDEGFFGISQRDNSNHHHGWVRSVLGF